MLCNCLNSIISEPMITTSRHNVCYKFISDLESGKLGYTKVIAHAQREPDLPISVLRITAERSANQKYDLHLTPTHNMFVRKACDDGEFQAR